MPGTRVAAVPPTLWGVIVLLVAAGTLVLVPITTALPDLFRALANPAPLGSSAVARVLTLLVLIVLLMAAFFGFACLILARLLYRGDRVGRALTYVLCASLAGAVLFGHDQTTTPVLVLVASVGVIAVLAFAPTVQEHFTGLSAIQRDHPTSVVVARTLIAVLGGCALVLGVVFILFALVVGSSSPAPVGKFAVAGLVSLCGSVALLAHNRRLGDGSRSSRTVVTVVVSLYPVAVLIVGNPDMGSLIPFGLAAGIVAFLWVPDESRQHFQQQADPAPPRPVQPSSGPRVPPLPGASLDSSTILEQRSAQDGPFDWTEHRSEVRCLPVVVEPSTGTNAGPALSDPDTATEGSLLGPEPARRSARVHPLKAFQKEPEPSDPAGNEFFADLDHLESSLPSQDPRLVNRMLADSVLAARGPKPLLPSGCRLLVDRSSLVQFSPRTAVVEASLSGRTSGRWRLHLAREHGTWKLARMERVRLEQPGLALPSRELEIETVDTAPFPLTDAWARPVPGPHDLGLAESPSVSSREAESEDGSSGARIADIRSLTTPSEALYLVPAILGVIGSLLGWVAVRRRDRRMGRLMWVIGAANSVVIGVVVGALV